ncbi:hypothetical protein HQ403_01905 [Candidatus Kaiserbacteria bacterium]|nr:hypothetical protein [Candidatus Kaiserbacteria bacterium]
MILFFSILLFSDRNDTSADEDIAHQAQFLLKLSDVDAEIYWSARIAEVGDNEAYREFVDIETYMPDGSEHKRAHMFGGALYQQRGIDSFTVCDSSFHYGCFHEFIGRAVFEYGKDILEVASSKCVDALGTEGVLCQHGVGHSALAYYGYTQEDLKRALNTCRSLDEDGGNDPIRGCEGGAYMEFNMRTMLDEEDEVRPYGDQFLPCTNVSESYHLGCIFWQTQWWQEIFMRDSAHKYSSSIYTQMGENCREFTKDSSLLQACFAGIGNFGAGGVDYVIPSIVSLCDSAADNQEHSLFCRLRALKKTPAQKLDTQTPLEICTGLSGNIKKYCSAFTRNESDTHFTTDEGVRVDMSELLYFRSLR